MELAVIGPGAIGTWLAWRLSSVADVQLVGRRRSWLKEARRRMVVHVKTPRAKRPRPARVHPTLTPSGSPAAIFVCVKSGDTRGAVAHARRIAGPSTPVVSLQNGLAHLAPLSSAFGPRRAVFAACYAAVGREGPAAFRHHAGQLIWLGRSPHNGEAATAARELLRAAALDVPPPGREDRVLWTKLVFNAATNPIGALTARANGELAEPGALREMLRAALREAEGAARAAGHAPLIVDLAAFVQRACRTCPQQENSMLQDLRAGRPTEVDAILEPILLAARRTGKQATVLASLRVFVRRLERELAS